MGAPGGCAWGWGRLLPNPARSCRRGAQGRTRVWARLQLWEREGTRVRCSRGALLLRGGREAPLCVCVPRARLEVGSQAPGLADVGHRRRRRERMSQTAPSTHGQGASRRRDWSGAAGRRGDLFLALQGRPCALCGRVLRPEGESCTSTWPPGASGTLWAQLRGPCGMWPCHQRP